ncbi:hypothetical protein BH11ARM2_BH11ARM2_10830 [soil metagenome]
MIPTLLFAMVTQGWTPIPLRASTAQMGGEGAQVITSLAADGSGRFLLMGIDVAGIYRSSDGGASWSPATVGYWPRGCSAVGIDPKNPKRCLAIGANSATGDWHGPWISTDGAASWRATPLRAKIAGHQDSRVQIAYDPASFDGERTRTVYWSRVRNDAASWGTPDVHPAIYRSDDGGETWRELPGSEKAAGGVIRCAPGGGTVYAAGADGLYRSDDGGGSWRLLKGGRFEGFDVSADRPGAVWANTADGVCFSGDGGKSWSDLPAGGLAEKGYVLKNLSVSPVDASRMVVWRYQEPNQWDWRRYASSDGGKSWTRAEFDNTGAFLPYNVRGASFVWSPKDPKKLWSVGGDWPTVSRDGGLTYRYSGAGDTGILVGGMWNFCAADPDTVFFGSQDYNGAITSDGGATGTYTNVSGNGWGGFVYGGYAVTPKLLVAGNADGWGGKRILRVSKDGGATWRDTGIALGGPDVSFGVAGDPKVAFAHDRRTGDGGATWTKMDGCDGVFTSGAKGELLGTLGHAVVRSLDKGRTWTTVADAPDEVRDLAYDPVRKRVYAVLGDRAAYWAGGWNWLDLPKNQFGGTNARSVAVDPAHPEVVYVASAANVFSTTVAMVRSTNAGKTWTNLTHNSPLKPGERDGAREGLCVRVHPITREAWVSTSCYGLWKIGPPAPSVR